MSTIFVTDSAVFGNSIRVVLTYDFRSPDGHTTRTGSATFTYARTRLADYLARPKVLCTLDDLQSGLGGVNGQPLGKAKFVAVRCATGRLPGWAVFFGPQDDQPDAFTLTITDPGNPAHPIISKLAARCDLEATCTLVAPGRRDGGAQDESDFGRSGFAGFNQGYHADAPGATLVDDANCTVELVQPAMVATTHGPAVNPVYRVTMPAEAEFIATWSPRINGSVVPVLGGEFVGSLPAVFCGQQDAAADGLYNGLCTVHPRSATIYDVQMANLSDTLAPGTVSYLKGTATDSVVTVNGTDLTIPNPFSLSTVTSPKDETGLSIEVTF